MAVESKEWTQSPGSLNRHPVQQRPDRSKLMVPEEINGSGVRSDWRSRENSRDFRINFKEEQFRTRSGFISSSEDEDDAVDDSNLDEMNLPTTQKSVDGVVMQALLRSSRLRLNFKEEQFRASRSSGRSTTSSASFKSDWSKDHNPDFKGQSSLKVSLENQQTASTESDRQDGHTEEFKEGKFSFEKMLRDSVRRLLRRVSKNNMEM